MRIDEIARKIGIICATVTLRYKKTTQKVTLDTIEKTCLLFGCK